MENLPDNTNSSQSTPWYEIARIKLNSDHQKVLATSGWLDDNIIAASQFLLKAQHPAVGSLQPLILASTLAMEPQTGEFVQILNLCKTHWIVVSTVGCQLGHINMCDSLHMTLSKNIKKVIADLLRHQGSNITLNHCDVQWQSGSSDCGVFAIAFATAICAGHNPAAIVFNQRKMREHLA